MAQFPTSIPSYAGFTASHTLSADNHASQHNSEQGDITAIATKVGTGSSTSTNNTVLRGNGTGTSTWAQVNVATDVTGTLAVANGGTGTTTSTGSGSTVLSTSPTLSSPVISSISNTGTLTLPTSTDTLVGRATTDTLTNKTLTTPTIGDFTNATHTHAATASGGLLGADVVADSNLVYGKLRSRQGNSATDWHSSGTTTFDYSATNTFLQVGCRALTGSTTITFPTAFNQIPLVFATPITAAGANTFARISAITATTFDINVITDAGAQGSETVSWLAIGE